MLVSTEHQTLNDTDGEVLADAERHAAAMAKETKKDMSDVESSKKRSSPYIDPTYIWYSDQEVSP